MSGVVKVQSLLPARKAVKKAVDSETKKESTEDHLNAIKALYLEKEKALKKAQNEIEATFAKNCEKHLKAVKKNSTVDLKIEAPFDDWELSTLKDLKNDPLGTILFFVGQRDGEYKEFYLISDKSGPQLRCIYVEEDHEAIKKHLIKEISKTKMQTCCSFCQSIFHKHTQCAELKEERNTICPICSKKGHSESRCIQNKNRSIPAADDEEEVDDEKVADTESK